MSGLKDGVIRRGATWSYVVRVRDPQSGRGRPRWVGGFHSYSEAAAARDDARVAARGGWLGARSQLTVGEYLDNWLSEHTWLITAATKATYRRTIAIYITPRLGALRLQELRPDTVTRFYQDLLEHGSRTGGPLAAVTVESVHIVLRKALEDAVWITQLILVNPAAHALRPRRNRHVDRDLWTPDQLRVFLHTAQRHRLGPYYWLAAYTGARRGELLALRWTDLHPGRAQLSICRSAGYADGARFEGPPRTAAPAPWPSTRPP
jgi:integrase